MSAITPVGEFGSKAWCEACAAAGVRMLADADLPPDLQWAFSEIYTNPPERLLTDGRKISAYYFMVKSGQIAGGDGAPDECRAMPGFHVSAPWAAICNQSATKYGREGQQQRSAEEKMVFQAIDQYVGRPNVVVVRFRENVVWPQEIVDALSKNAEEGGGLHNVAASLQAHSPEFEDFPTTEMGVPDFERMTSDQKERFLDLIGVEK